MDGATRYWSLCIVYGAAAVVVTVFALRLGALAASQTSARAGLPR
jgi:hypothetical protein